jgi:hypothetical protein
MGIDRSGPADGPEDAPMDGTHSASDDRDVTSADKGTRFSGDRPPGAWSPTHSDSAWRTEWTAAYCGEVDAVYRRYAIDHGYARVEELERETITPAMHRIEEEDPQPHPADLDDRLKGPGRLAEADDLKRGETRQVPDDTTAASSGRSALPDQDRGMRDLTISGNGNDVLYMVAESRDNFSAYRADEDVPVLVDNGGNGGDVPDDPRNYSNPKTGRSDASWSRYDRATAAAREHTGGDLGPDSIKMYDYNPETREGTGTLIGEQTPDRLRGWRIDGQDGHVNWWNWTGGKKGAGGVYGHDWFPEDASTPGSRYIGWAPWQSSDGTILEGN